MTWRDKYTVHPAADVFPMMGDDELKALGEDIKVNGLQEPLTFWWQTTPKRQRLLVDGRNRLEAMQRAGIELPRTIAVRNGSHTITAQNVIEGDPVAFIMSANIRRRHLTKQQQADLILAAIKAAPIVRQRGEKIGKGRPVDVVKAAAVKAGTEHGISKRTVERAFAKADDKEKSAERIARAKAAAEKRKAKREADRKERAERFRESFGLGAREGDGSWQRLAKVLVVLSSDHEGERHAAADAANKILPMGWQLVKAPLDRSLGRGLSISWMPLGATISNASNSKRISTASRTSSAPPSARLRASGRWLLRNEPRRCPRTGEARMAGVILPPLNRRNSLRSSKRN
jgi:hypothetical protein